MKIEHSDFQYHKVILSFVQMLRQILEFLQLLLMLIRYVLLLDHEQMYKEHHQKN